LIIHQNGKWIKIIYNLKIYHRHSIRLLGYDYSKSGAYFITIVSHDRECLFGKIVDGKMILNENGEIVDTTWNDLPNHNDNISLDEFVIIPNHNNHRTIYILSFLSS